jgi:hypothetical protein
LAVERPEEIRPALEAAFALGRTACINVAVDLSVISPESVALANLGGLPEIGGTPALFSNRGFREGHIGDPEGLSG